MTRNILVVDDDRSIHEIIYEIFSPPSDYLILSAYSGKDALDLMKKEFFDYILLDGDLGNGMRGHEVAREMSLDDKMRKILIINISADASDSCYQSLLNKCNSNVVAHISKPFDIFELRGAVGRTYGVEQEI